MNLQQLISLPDLDFLVFKETLTDVYGVSKPTDYLAVMEEMFMLELDPEAETTLQYILVPEMDTATPTIDQIHDADPVFDVGVYNPVDGKKYACDYTPWNQLLAYQVDEAIALWVGQDIMLVEELLAHILHEITFYGMTAKRVDEQIQYLLEVIQAPVFEIPDSDVELLPEEKYVSRWKEREEYLKQIDSKEHHDKLKEALDEVEEDKKNGIDTKYFTHEDVFPEEKKEGLDDDTQ